MPISQSRIIALANAAADYEQAFDKLITLIQSADRRVRSGQTSLPDEWNSFIADVDPLMLLTNPRETPKIIAVERAHFHRVERANNRAAARMAEKRSALNPRGPTPRSLVPAYETHRDPITTAPRDLMRHGAMTGSIASQVETYLARQGEAAPESPTHKDFTRNGEAPSGTIYSEGVMRELRGDFPSEEPSWDGASRQSIPPDRAQAIALEADWTMDKLEGKIAANMTLDDYIALRGASRK